MASFTLLKFFFLFNFVPSLKDFVSIMNIISVNFFFKQFCVFYILTMDFCLK